MVEWPIVAFGFAPMVLGGYLTYRANRATHAFLEVLRGGEEEEEQQQEPEQRKRVKAKDIAAAERKLRQNMEDLERGG